MTEKELERILAKGMNQAGRFFSVMEPVRYRGAAAQRKPLRRFRLCLAAVALVVAVCAGIGIFAAPRGNAPEPVNAANSFGVQMVALGADREYSMSYIPTSQNGSDTGLMMVLWEQRNGSHQVAYHSVFESCDTVYPAMTVPLADADDKLLLVSSGNSARNELGYRLIGYCEGALQTWWARDRVPEGVVEVSGGVLMETSTLRDGRPTAAVQVMYIVPVQANPQMVALPIESLALQPGDRLLLAACGADNLTAHSENGLLAPAEETEEGVLLEAVAAGNDVVWVEMRGVGQTLAVIVAD